VALVAGCGGDLLGYESRFETKVDETGSGHGWWLANVSDAELGNDFFGKRARIFFALFRKGHDAVGLIVAKLRIGAGPNQGRATEGVLNG